MLKKFIFYLFCLVILIPLNNCNSQSSGDETVAVITTKFGEITLFLYKDTPLHTKNFVKLADSGLYNGTTFHRVIKDFMIQGGDPNSKNDNPQDDGQGNMPYTIPAEFKYPKYFHKRGAVCAARLGDQANPKKESSGCQFYIVQGEKFTESALDTFEMQMTQMKIQNFAKEYLQRPEYEYLKSIDPNKLHKENPDSLARLNSRLQSEVTAAYEKTNGKFKMAPEARKVYTEVGGAPFLDEGYTVFGEVLAGQETVTKITEQPTDAQANRPNENITMQVKILKLSKEEIKKKYNYDIR